MGFFYLFAAIFSESTAKTIDKLNFRRNHITSQYLMYLVFLSMTISLGLFVVITHQTFPEFSLISLGLVIAIGLVSFLGNVFDFLSLKADDLSLREPLVDFEPILAGLVGYALFPGERKPAFLLAFILGAFIVQWGIHRRKLGRLQRKGMTYLLLAVALYATLPSLYKYSLEHMAPAYIAFLRVVCVLILTSIFFPYKRVKKIFSKKTWYGLASGTIYAAGAAASLYAINIFGVVVSMLFSMLGPSLRYLAGYFILKEKVRKGEVIASFLLIAVVIVAALFR